MSLLLCLGGALEVEVVRLLSESDPAVDIARRCADHAEVMAAAEAGVGSIAVLREWDLRLSRHLHRCGVVIVGVDDSEDPNLDPRRRGCDALASPFPGDVAACVRGLVEATAGGAGIPPAGEKAIDVAGAEADDWRSEGKGPRGTLVAVWGSQGSPGRSTLARDVACALARRHKGVLLVDADMYAPSLSQLLSVESETSAIVGAVRRLNRGDAGDVLRECAVRVHGVDFIAGLNRGSRWREVPADVAKEMWRRARIGWEAVVVDCAAPNDPMRGIGGRGGDDRNAVTRCVVECADVLLCVGQANPVGVRRLIDAVEEHGRQGGARPALVVAKAPPAYSSARADVAKVLEWKGMSAAAWIRSCPAEYAKAELSGVPLEKEAPSCVAAKDVDALALRLVIENPALGEPSSEGGPAASRRGAGGSGARRRKGGSGARRRKGGKGGTAEKGAASVGAQHRHAGKRVPQQHAGRHGVGDGAEESRLRRMKRLFPLRKRRQGNASGASDRT